MDTDRFVAQAESRLAAGGFQTSWISLAGRRALLGRQSKFRWRWFAVWLHTFVVIAEFADETVTRDLLDGFLDDVRNYALENVNRRFLGLQMGIAVVPVAAVSAASEPTRQWAQTSHGRRYGALPFPVLVDLAGAAAFCPKRMIWGGIFAGYLRGIVRDCIEPALRATP